jgi:Fe-S cluster assembly ATPase SufC
VRKIDLHIHTISTISDRAFDFDLANLEWYVRDAEIDAIAITNHNLFDRSQYLEISSRLESTIFPGIEIDVAGGHLLIIAEHSDLDRFCEETGKITDRITTATDSISIDELKSIFPDLSRYLLIPHYEKKPAIRGDALERLAEHVSAGEVDSAKKFIRATKDPNKLTPVLFSDARFSSDLSGLPTRQTYVDCGELTLNALKSCFNDKGKVALSEADGNSLFQIFADRQMLSTGLNVLLGARSTGKTHTLDRINSITNNVKYIEQFSLVQKDDDSFEEAIKKERSQFIDSYLASFKSVLDEIMSIDAQADDRAVSAYLESVLKAGEDADKKDAFSKVSLFDETSFSIGDNEVLNRLIGSVRQIIENVEYRHIIDKYVEVHSLRTLITELIDTLRNRDLDRRKKKLVNELVQDIRKNLKMRTSAVQIEDVDFYRVALNKKKIDKFSEIVKCLQDPATIAEESIQGFTVVARKEPFSGAGEIKKASGVKTAFQNAFSRYHQPYAYLQELISNESLRRADLYRLFTNITYKVLNRDGYEVSGGERSEFRLLQQIKDAQNYDLLLIDEPESSFDNIFLRSDVNEIIREIANSMPVVVVTHNSTVGASVDADYLLYASKEVQGGDIVYRIYSGYPTDQLLTSTDGKSIATYEVLLDSLEAGGDAYVRRRDRYEAVKN